MTTFNKLSIDDFEEECNNKVSLSLNYDYCTDSIVPKKIYLAGPWFDPHALRLCTIVENVISLHFTGKHTYFFPRQDGNSANIASPEDIFKLNCLKVEKCDTVIAIISRKDVGTAWEIGMAYAQHKEVILLAYDETDFTESKTNLMLAFCGKCITLSKLVKYLCNKMTDEDWFTFDKKNWGVIE